MSHPLHICLGANGDIAALLPWMKWEADRTGEPIRLLVASPYLPLLEGVSYVTPIEWGFKNKKMPGTFHQLHDARRYLKINVPDCEVKVLQFYGSGETVTFPSFLHEMFYNAGALCLWDKLPLVFDKRDRVREAKLRLKFCPHPRRPTILVATKGKSSPFKYAKQLLHLVQSEFGSTHNVIDLNKVVAEKPFDLLGLYDEADALVTIDTMHAHLSRASTVPTFVWARDYPNTWHGIPWEARFKFHARYGSYPKRKDEFLRRMGEVIGGTVERPEIVPFKDPHFRGHYNPCNLGLWTSTRAHFNMGGMTKLWMSELLQKPEPIRIKTPANVSHEDMRMFMFKGKHMASYVLAKQLKNKDFRCVVEIAELVPKKDHWTVHNRIRPQVKGNTWNGKTKNLVFFEHDGKLKAFINEDRIATFDERGKVTSIRHQNVKWDYGEIRGGTVPLSSFHTGGYFIRFFHSRTQDQRYHIGAMLLTQDVLSIRKISRHPILSGDERWTPGLTHWKPNVVFPMSASVIDGGWQLVIGVNDSSCATVNITPKMLNL